MLWIQEGEKIVMRFISKHQVLMLFYFSQNKNVFPQLFTTFWPSLWRPTWKWTVKKHKSLKQVGRGAEETITCLEYFPFPQPDWIHPVPFPSRHTEKTAPRSGCFTASPSEPASGRNVRGPPKRQENNSNDTRAPKPEFLKAPSPAPTWALCARSNERKSAAECVKEAQLVVWVESGQMTCSHVLWSASQSRDAACKWRRWRAASGPLSVSFITAQSQGRGVSSKTACRIHWVRSLSSRKSCKECCESETWNVCFRDL